MTYFLENLSKLKMSRRRGNHFEDVQYQKLDQFDQPYLDSQIQQSCSQTIPWKAIALAVLLCIGGLFMLIMGSLIVAGHVDTKVRKLFLIFLIYLSLFLLFVFWF